METGDLNPAALPPGTRVGPWRVVDLQGRGMYGTVYRAVGADSKAAGFVALKLARAPRDERFAREAELLWRIHHPGVPRLLGSGEWRAPSGASFPYLAMEWMEGVPLYAWARWRPPSSRQVLVLLAGLARALGATHAAGGVHRDVKGDNVLVRASDAWPFLIDFGAGHFLGASTLTGPLLPPGTPAYRSPEAWRYGQRAHVDSAPPYPAGPADDVFALGVTAYRLMTGEYPSPPDAAEDASDFDFPEDTWAPSPRELNGRCCAELNAIVSRMLSLRPEARGSAGELADALEQAAREAGPEADALLFAPDAPRPVRVRGSVPRRVTPRARGRGWWPWLAVAGLGGGLALGAGWAALSVGTEDEAAEEPVASREEAQDGGAVAVGDSALTAPVAPVQGPSAWSAIAVELPPQPLPGQLRPNAAGRCPSKVQVAIHGGCWMRLAADPKDCDAGNYVYKGACYSPVFPPPRPATSGPSRSPERR